MDTLYHIPQIILISNPLIFNQTNNTILTHSSHSDERLINVHINQTAHKHDSDNFTKLFTNPHHFINGNPLQFKQCRNAILDKENINIKDFISKHIQHLSKTNQQQIETHFNDIIWSRELLHALSKKLPYGHLVRIRLSYDANNKNWQGSRARQRDESLDAFTTEYRLNHDIAKQLLVYYHVSKCGSSSIHNMLKMHYNTTRMFWRDLLDLNAFPVLPDIDCAFTFVRHPIDRIISGFYTILTMLNREFDKQANGNKAERVRIIQKYGISHAWFVSNGSAKIRFKLFVKEVIERGYEYVTSDHLMLHVVSQIGSSIGAFHLWPIHFMGRIEYFEQHWYFLTMEHEKCSKVFDSVSRGDHAHSYELAHAMKRMAYNLIDSEDVNGDKEKRNEFEKKGLSAEHFAFIEDEELFYQTVDYFYQDFVCFGYNMTHQAYLKHLNDKYII